jgi:diguanylate cyclase (GGDEF)-like protein
MQKKVRNKTVTKTVIDLQNISYELRTPLNAIWGFAQLLEADSSILTSPQRESVNQILKASCSMLASVNKISDLTEQNSLSFQPNIELSHPQKLTSTVARKSVLVAKVEDVFNAKILIVDDQEANVLLLEQILHEAGYTAIASTMNPYSVGVLHRKNNYDLILLDLQMPGLDGFQIMENLKKTESDGYLPVIVVSAHEKYRVRALEEGAQDFISKPFDLYEVLMRIYNMLQVRLLHKESKNYSLTLEKIVCDLRETESNLLSAEDILSKEKAVLNVNVMQLREANALLVSDNIKAHTLTEETEKAKLKMTELAQHDVLTGLPNRLLLNDRLEQMIILAGRQSNLFAVLFLDLDNFKLINDVHGHSVGDQVLQMVAKRLLTCVRHSDTVCRQGGDEFVILLTDIEHPEYAIKGTKSVERKILTALAKPYVIGEIEIQTSASIGISMYPDNGLDAETLIRNADTAMYRAKESGHDSYQFFE